MGLLWAGGRVGAWGVPVTVAADPTANRGWDLSHRHESVSGFVPLLVESAVEGSEGASGHRPVREQILLYPGVQELER